MQLKINYAIKKNEEKPSIMQIHCVYMYLNSKAVCPDRSLFQTNESLNSYMYYNPFSNVCLVCEFTTKIISICISDEALLHSHICRIYAFLC